MTNFATAEKRAIIIAELLLLEGSNDGVGGDLKRVAGIFGQKLKTIYFFLA